MTATDSPGTARVEVPLGAPWFDKHEESLVAEVLRSGWVTQGPVVARFEAAVAEFVGVEHAVAVTSATTGLFAVLQELGIGPGDEVICPSFTYIATANAIVHAGARPVFVDVDPLHWSLDPAAVEAAITPRTAAVMPVHLWWAADAAAIYGLAHRHGLAVVEDGAPALGARYAPDFGGRRVGDSDGPVVLSFHPRKIITTGEGGMVLTGDAALAERLRRMRHHHMDVSDAVRHASRDIVFEKYPEVGHNFRMSDLQAAVGVAQMAKLPTIRSRRAAVAATYDRAFGSCNDLELLHPPAGEQSFQSYMVVVRPDAALTRDDLMRTLLDRGVTTRRGIMSSHLEQAHHRGRAPVALPVSERLSSTGVLLPISPQMSESQVEHVIESVLHLLG